MPKSCLKYYRGGNGVGGWECVKCNIFISAKNERELENKIKMHLKYKHNILGNVSKDDQTKSFYKDGNDKDAFNQNFVRNKLEKQSQNENNKIK